MSRRQILLFLAALFLVYFNALGTIPLLEPDEGRYAEIPREMLVSGDFVTPHLNGVVYLEKPPLFYWGTAISLAIFGQNEFGARFFTAAVSVAGLLLTFWMGSVLAGPRTGLFSAAVLATTFYYYPIGRLNTLDMTLAVCLALSIFSGYLYCSGRRPGRTFLYLSYAAAGLAFLAKGLIGVVFPAAVILIWFVLAGRYREALRAISPAGIAIFLAIALPWVVLVQMRNPDFFRFFFVQEHFLRYATKMHHRAGPLWYFIPVVIAGFLPWIAFLPQAVRSARRSAETFFRREDLLFLLTWALFILFFFSVSRSKLVTYAAPVFPPLAVLFGRALDLFADGKEDAAPLFLPAAVGTLLAAGVLVTPFFSRHHEIPASAWLPLAGPPAVFILGWGAVPLFLRRLGAFRTILVCFLLAALFLSTLNPPAAKFLGEYKSVKGLARALSESVREGDIVAQYGAYRQAIPFYTKRRTVLVNEVGELEYGMRHAADRAEWFLSDVEFFRLWNSGARVLCYFKADQYPIVEQKFPNHRLIYRSGEGILVVNRN